MKKMIINCDNITAEAILERAKSYFAREEFEVQDVVTESGEVGIQARKTSWYRNITGTSYAAQIIVKKLGENRYEVTAGWGKWLDKGVVAIVATFVAFGVLIIPTLIGIRNQLKLPTECLDYVANGLSAQYNNCRCFYVAAA